MVAFATKAVGAYPDLIGNPGQTRQVSPHGDARSLARIRFTAD
jgi:hypothetical protein